jgi:Fur family ferric uptake transcriptional regulator
MDPGDRVWRFGLLRACGEHAHEHKGHAHFVCDACGVIRCLDDATINVSLKGRGTEQRLRIKQQDVYLHGTCEACQDEEAPPERTEQPARIKPRR